MLGAWSKSFADYKTKYLVDVIRVKARTSCEYLPIDTNLYAFC